MTCQTDTRAFERMLRENGFSRSRAKVITAKGFKAADMDMDETQEVANLIDTLKASQLRLEEKRRYRVDVTAGPFWSAWKILASLTFDRPGRFKISAKSLNHGALQAPYMLKIKYTSRRGPREALWLSRGGRAGNSPYYQVPAGMQEILVSARGHGQRVIVELD